MPSYWYLYKSVSQTDNPKQLTLNARSDKYNSALTHNNKISQFALEDCLNHNQVNRNHNVASPLAWIRLC